MIVMLLIFGGGILGIGALVVAATENTIAQFNKQHEGQYQATYRAVVRNGISQAQIEGFEVQAINGLRLSAETIRVQPNFFDASVVMNVQTSVVKTPDGGDFTISSGDGLLGYDHVDLFMLIFGQEAKPRSATINIGKTTGDLQLENGAMEFVGQDRINGRFTNIDGVNFKASTLEFSGIKFEDAQRGFSQDPMAKIAAMNSDAVIAINDLYVGLAGIGVSARHFDMDSSKGQELSQIILSGLEIVKEQPAPPSLLAAREAKINIDLTDMEQGKLGFKSLIMKAPEFFQGLSNPLVIKGNIISLEAGQANAMSLRFDSPEIRGGNTGMALATAMLGLGAPNGRVTLDVDNFLTPSKFSLGIVSPTANANFVSRLNAGLVESIHVRIDKGAEENALQSLLKAAIAGIGLTKQAYDYLQPRLKAPPEMGLENILQSYFGTGTAIDLNFALKTPLSFAELQQRWENGEALGIDWEASTKPTS